MVQVQRVRLPNSGQLTWTVIGKDYLPIAPIQTYLNYLESLERSPNTIQSYAGHLKLFWEFIQTSDLDWETITLENLADFIHWLRCPDPRTIPLQPQPARRTERTINTILSAICGFYEFQERIGAMTGIDVYRYQFQPGQKYKPFLHHISKSKAVKTRLLKVKEPKTFPGCLTIANFHKVRQVILTQLRHPILTKFGT